MIYTIDTEFHDTGRYIDLISIAIVCEDGREYYAIHKDFDILKAWKNEWIRENVLVKIYQSMPPSFKQGVDFTYLNMRLLIKNIGKSKQRIAHEIYYKPMSLPMAYSGVLGLREDPDVKLIGYYSAYDHVVFCQLWGPMVNLPKGLPWYTFDIKQEIDRLGIKHSDLPPVEHEHHPLWDARWNMKVYELCKLEEKKRR